MLSLNSLTCVYSICSDIHVPIFSEILQLLPTILNNYLPVRLNSYLCINRTSKYMGVVGWCDGAGSTSSAGASYNLNTVGQGPIALAVGAGGGVRTFLLSSILSLWGGRVVRWCWVNFQCRGVLQFGLQ